MATEIEFEINDDTGELTSTVHGVEGPACEQIAREVQKLMGAPSRDEKTADYFKRAAGQKVAQRR